MFVRGRRLALAALFAAVALLGAGCGGGGSKPVSLPSLSPSATASPTPSATSSASIRGAVVGVVRRYYALLNAPTTVTNGQALAALMTADCTCRRVATSTIDVAQKHESYFGKTRVVSITPVVDGPTAADALVEYDYNDSGIKDAAGHITSRSPGRRGSKLMFYFRLTGGSWLISQVRPISDGRRA